MPLLPTRTVEKVWGRRDLPPPFASHHQEPVGEIWFEPPPELKALLVKYIFTSEKLSVQLHPTDAQAEAAGQGRQGKEECWFILDAEPGASLAIGFDEPLSGEQIRSAALDGSIEQRMTWHPVKPGNFFYIPANTVHAIGAGISLIEIQQNSDITYRLYDYGRPRELHLDEGVPIALGTPYPGSNRQHIAPAGEQWLVDGPLFRVLRYDGFPSADAAARFAPAPVLAIPITGEAEVAGERVRPGQCALARSVGDIVPGAGTRGLIAQPLPEHANRS